MGDSSALLGPAVPIRCTWRMRNFTRLLLFVKRQRKSFIILIKHVQRGLRRRDLLPLPLSDDEAPLVALQQADLQALRSRLRWLVSNKQTPPPSRTAAAAKSPTKTSPSPGRLPKTSPKTSLMTSNLSPTRIAVTEVRTVTTPTKSRSEGRFQRRNDPVEAAAARLNIDTEDLNDILSTLSFADFKRLKEDAAKKKAGGGKGSPKSKQNGSRSRGNKKPSSSSDGGLAGTTL